MTAREECGNCRFWSERTDNTKDMGGGFCRRYPPFFPSGLRVWQTGTTTADIETSAGFLNDAWPNVSRQSWCGEFRTLQSQEASNEG